MRWAHVVVAGLVSASAAGAQPSNPQAYCIAGAPACFAMGYGFQSSTLSIFLQSLQGSWAPPGQTITTSNYGIGALAIIRIDQSGHVPPEELLVSAPLNLGTPVGNIFVGGDQFWPRDDCAAQGCTSAFFDHGANGVVGCSFDTQTYGFAVAFQTCPANGMNGWARFDFGLTLQDGANGTTLPVALDDFAFTVFDSNGQYCAWNGANSGAQLSPAACTAYAYPFASVSPEPATLALLAPAVIGIAGIRRRRAA